MALTKQVGGLAAAHWKPITPPDFIKAAAIASVTHQQILLAHAQPPGDPDIDGVFLRQCPQPGPLIGFGLTLKVGRHALQALRLDRESELPL